MSQHAARAVVSGPDGTIEVVDIAVEDPGPGEVLVEIGASGVCHTDLDIARHVAGFVLGHEGAGTVVAIGDGVSTVRPGERVVLSWSMPCHACPACARGDEHLCERLSPLVARRAGHAHRGGTRRGDDELIRVFNLGTMSTLTLVRHEAIQPLPDDVADEIGAIAGCAVMTGVGSVLNASPVGPGDSVVVLGCGGVGLNVVQGARIAGATEIVAVDPSDRRLELARSFGATICRRPDGDDTDLSAVAAVIHRLTGGGADVAFECTAVPELGVAPLRMIRHGGTAVQVSGVERSIMVDMQLFEWDKTYLNPLYGKCRPARDFPRLFELYRSGVLDIDTQIGRTYPIDDVVTAFDDMLAGVHAKGVLVMAP